MWKLVKESWIREGRNYLYELNQERSPLVCLKWSKNSAGGEGGGKS